MVINKMGVPVLEQELEKVSFRLRFTVQRSQTSHQMCKYGVLELVNNSSTDVTVSVTRFFDHTGMYNIKTLIGYSAKAFLASSKPSFGVTWGKQFAIEIPFDEYKQYGMGQFGIACSINMFGALVSRFIKVKVLDN